MDYGSFLRNLTFMNLPCSKLAKPSPAIVAEENVPVNGSGTADDATADS